MTTIITILILFIAFILLSNISADYISRRNMAIMFGWGKVKIINIEELIDENGYIRKLSRHTKFLRYITLKKEQYELIPEKISELQSMLVSNGYFISYSDLLQLLEVMGKEGYIELIENDR